jgi:hypothetical protein
MPNSYCLAFCIINYEHMGLAMHSSASEEMRGYCRCSHEQRIKQKPIEEHLCRPNRTLFYAWQAFNFCKDVFLNSATISKFPKYFDSPCVVLDITTNTAPTRSSSLHLHFKSFSPFRPMRAQLDRNLEMQVSTSQSFASTTGTIWVFCLVGKNTKPQPRSTLKAEVTSPRECALAREIQVAFLSPTHKHRLLFVAFLTRRGDNYHKNVCPSKSIFLAAIFPIIVIIVLR